MVLLFSLLFYVVATSKAITSHFSSALDYSTSLKKAISYVVTRSVYLPLLLCTRNVGLGVSHGFFQGLRTGLKTCSIQMLWICDVVERTFGLQGKHSLILFARAVAPVIFFLWHAHMHVTIATKDLHFEVFQAKRDAIKWNISSARLPTSIYWLTTLGFQLTKHVG